MANSTVYCYVFYDLDIILHIDCLLMGDSTKKGGFSAKMFKPINTVVHLIMVHPAEFPSRGYFINVLHCLIVVKHGGSSMLTARKGGRKTFTKER